jgi:predicted small lipoprotein YifL
MDASPRLSFIESPFNTKVEYEAYLRGEVMLPTDAAEDISDAMAAKATIAGAEAWGPLEYPPARKAALQAQFDEQASGGRLALRAVHTLIFTSDERKECASRRAPLPAQNHTDGASPLSHRRLRQL